METVVIIGFFVTIYLLVEIKGRVDHQSKVLEEQSEKLSALEDKLSEIQSELTNVEAAIDTITPDSARVDELVRHGFDHGDAWEHVLTRGKDKAPNNK
jgi:predicted nuclease with TOPRIM domain